MERGQLGFMEKKMFGKMLKYATIFGARIGAVG